MLDLPTHNPPKRKCDSHPRLCVRLLLSTASASTWEGWRPPSNPVVCGRRAFQASVAVDEKGLPGGGRLDETRTLRRAFTPQPANSQPQEGAQVGKDGSAGKGKTCR